MKCSVAVAAVRSSCSIESGKRFDSATKPAKKGTHAFPVPLRASTPSLDACRLQVEVVEAASFSVEVGLLARGERNRSSRSQVPGSVSMLLETLPTGR